MRMSLSKLFTNSEPIECIMPHFQSSRFIPSYYFWSIKVRTIPLSAHLSPSIFTPGDAPQLHSRDKLQFTLSEALVHRSNYGPTFLSQALYYIRLPNSLESVIRRAFPQSLSTFIKARYVDNFLANLLQ